MSRRTKVTSREKPWFVAVHDDFFELKLDPYAQAAYLWLKRRYGDGGNGPVYESVKKMAEATSMSPRRFHSALDRLEELRLIEGNRALGQTTEFVITDKSEWVIPDRTSAPHAHVPMHQMQTPSAPDADPPMHHVQTGSAPRADTSRYKEVDTRKKERGRTPQPESAANSPESLSSSQGLSTETQIEVALRHPESAEARALLEAHGVSTDERPLWELKSFLRRTLGDQADHPQIVGNLPAWTGQHSLLDIRSAWSKAVARRKREPNGLRAILHFVDILNGTYKPDAAELAEAAAASAAAKRQAQRLAPKSGDRVRLPDGEIDTVRTYDAAGDWVILEGRAELYRPADCQVQA